MNIQPDQQLFTMVHCFFLQVKANVLCSEVDAESKNVIGMIVNKNMSTRVLIHKQAYFKRESKGTEKHIGIGLMIA